MVPASNVTFGLVKDGALSNIATAGMQYSYFLTLTNSGSAASPSAAVTDVLPSGLVRVGESANAGNPDIFNDISTGNTPIFQANSVGAGKVDTFTVTVSVSPTVTNGAQLVNTVNVTDANVPSDTATASITTTISAFADLTLTKSGNPGTVAAGNDVTYTLQVSNGGPADSNGVTLTDVLPSGMTVVALQPSGGNVDSFSSAGVGTGTATFIGKVSFNTPTTNTDTFFVTALVPSTQSNGKLTDAANVVATTPDPNSGNNSASATTSVTVSADLAVAKTGPSTITGGTTTSYAITVTNNGPSSDGAVTLVDNLPAGLSIVTETSSGPYNFAPVVAFGSNLTLTLASGAMAPATAETFTVTVTASPTLATVAGSSIANTATVSTSSGTDTVSSNNTASVTSAVSAAFNLSLTKTGPAAAVAGTTITYDITVSNAGPSNAPGTTVTDVLPAGLTLVGEGQVSGPDTFVATSPGGTATFKATTVEPTPSGVPDVLAVTAAVASTVAPNTTVADIATLTVPTNLAFLTAAASTRITTVFDLSVTKTGPTSITAGTSAIYTLVITNSGPSEARSVVLSDALPTDLGLIAGAQLGGPDAFSTTIVNGHTISFTAATVAASATDTFLVTVSAPSTLSVGTLEIDVATVTPTDATPTDNIWSQTSTITTSWSLGITKNGPTSITAGVPVSYTLTLNNNGPSNAANVTVTDVLPSDFNQISTSEVLGSDVFTTVLTGNTVTFTANTMAPGTDELLVVANVPASVTAVNETNVATIASSLSSASTTVVTPVTVSFDTGVVKTGQATITAGSLATFSLTLTNSGPSDAFNVTMTDVLPADLTLVSESKFSGPDVFTTVTSGQTVSFIASTVTPTTPGHSDVLLVIASVPSSLTVGTLESNTATIVSPVDANTANDKSTFVSTVTTSSDLSVGKSGPGQITAGTTFSYTLTLTNSGPSNAGTSLVPVTLSDVVPANLTLVGESQVAGPDVFSGPFVSGNTVSFTINSMLPTSVNNTDLFRIVVSAPNTLASGTPEVNVASVKPTDVSVADDSATVSSTIVSSTDLSLTKTGPTQITAGTTATYALTLTNLGPSSASNVVVTDALPTDLTIIGEGASGSNPDSFSTVVLNHTVSFSAATVLPTGVNPDILFITVAAPAALTGGTKEVDRAAVSSPSDNNAGNNTSTLTSTIATSFDLSVGKSDAVSSITAGSSTTYTLTLINNGPSNAASVTLSDVLPADLTLVSESSPAGNPDTFLTVANGNTVSFIATTMVPTTPGNTDLFFVVASAPSTLAATTKEVDNVTVTPSDSDGDESASFTSTVSVSADLTISKSGSSTVVAGTTDTFSLTIRNLGPSQSQSVSVTDTIPAGMTLIGESALVNNDNFINGSTPGNVLFTASAVAANSSDIFLVTVAASPTVASSTVLTNTATVTSAVTPDPTTPDTATFNTTITALADVAVVKSGPSRIAAGGSATYTLTVTNNGPSNAATVKVTDVVPANLTLVSESAISNPDGFVFSGSGLGATATFTAPTVAPSTPGSSDVLLVVVSASSALPVGTKEVDTATITSPTDTNPANNTSTVTSTITTSADLAVTKTGPVTITAGTTAVYSITLTNNGPVTSQNVTLTDNIPGNLTLVSETAFTNPDGFTNQSSGGNVVFQAASMPNGSQDVFLVTVTASPTLTTGASAIDVASATATTGDLNPGNNSSTVTSAIKAVADLAVSKSGPGLVTAGSTITYTLTVTNAGPSTAQGATVTDALPANLILLSESQVSGPDAFFGTGTGQGATATFTASTVAPSNGTSDVLLVVVSAPGTLANGSQQVDTATVSSASDPNPANNTATFTTNITASADLSVVKTGPTQITAGTTITYTLTLANSGPSTAQGVSLSDALPGNLTLIGENALVNNDGFTNNTSGSNVLFKANTVAAGNTDVFAVTVAVPASLGNGATAVDTATVSDSGPPDNNPANNTSRLTSTVVAAADLSITKSGPSQITAGTTATYTITLNNNGPSNAVNVSVTDALPANLTLLGETVSVNNDGFINNSSGSNVQFQAASVATGHSDVFLVTVAAAASLAGGQPAVDTASVSSPTDSTPADNSSTLTSNVVAVADLAVTKTGPNHATAGTTITYTLTANNFGPSNSQTTTVTDALPSNLVLLSESVLINNDNFVNISTGNSAQFVSPTMANGGNDVFLVVARIPANLPNGSTVTDTANIIDPGPVTPTDPNQSNNSSPLTTTITNGADVSIVKTGPSTITGASNATYTITVMNNGPSDAQNVSVTDTLPVSLTLVSEAAVINSDGFNNNTSGSNVLFTAATVKAGNTDIFQVTVSAPGTLSNGSIAVDRATVSSPTDTTPGNNTSTLTSTVSVFADLAVSKSGPATVTAGTTATYTLTFNSAGASQAQNVTLTDALPNGMQLVSAGQISGPDAFVESTSPGTVTFTVGAVASGNSDLFTVVARALSADPSGSKQADVFSASSTTPDSNNANNAFTLTSTVATTADLSVTKTGPTTVTAGTTVTYTLTVNNIGPSDAQSVTLTDALPSGLQLLAANVTTNNDSFTVPIPVGNTATFTAGVVAAGSSDVFTVVAKALSSDAVGTSQTDSATVVSATNDANQSNNTITVPSVVATSADLSIGKTGTVGVTAGGTTTYTFTLVNNGPSDAQNVNLTDVLPSGVTVLSERQLAGPDVFTQSSGNNVAFSAVSVGAGHQDVFQAVVQLASSLPNGFVLTDAAHVTSQTSDLNAANNAASFMSTVTTSADLSVTKTGPATFTAGATITYTVTLANNGPSDAQAVTMTDSLPGNLTLLTESAVVNNDGFVNTSSLTAPSFAAVAVAAGHTDIFQIVVGSASSMTNGSTTSDTVTVGSTTTDLAPGNNFASITSTATTSADLAVAVSGPAGSQEGATFTYTITVTNTGRSDSQNVTLTDVLPSGMSLVSASFALGTTTSGGGAVTDTIPTLAAGASVTGVVVVTAAEDGSYTSTVSVASTTTDPNAANNGATATTSVSELPIVITVNTISGTEFSPVNNAVVATFTHDGGVEPASAFGATINWGDGSASAGTVVQTGTTYQVLGTHTFSADGSSVIGVTVTEGGATATATAAAGAAEAPLPPDAPGQALDGPVNEGLDETFRAQPNGSQILTVEQGIFLLQERLFAHLTLGGLDPASASNDSWAIAWSQFNFLLNASGIFGGSLPAGVNFIATLLMQEAAQ